MHMNFTSEEVDQIIVDHLVEKLGVPRESVVSVYPIQSNGKYSGFGSNIKTEKAVPAGPYRTNAKGS